jgi:hypothetical protein
MDFIKNWKSTIVALLAVIIGVANQMFPAYQELFNQISVFLIAVLAFFTKDADVSGTINKPR